MTAFSNQSRVINSWCRLAVVAALVIIAFSIVKADDATFVSQRPPADKRKFTSDAVEQMIQRVKATIKDPELAWIFENCYPNTLDTTVDFSLVDGQPDTFIITGDIDAMWLRDSSAQVQGYLPLCPQDAHLRQMIEGLIQRQSKCILLDPYANAFYKDSSRVSPWKSDHTEMRPGVHERKWELDSLCYCLRLDYEYWRITGDTSPFDSTWKEAVKLAIRTMQVQQRKTDKGPYSFMRDGPRLTDTQVGGGFGNPWKPTGMICSAFRNSDDATKYQFNIPDNLFAVVSLRHLAELLDALHDTTSLASTCRSLADEVEKAVKEYGIVDQPGIGRMYAYETDGLGHYLLIDDAGIPSLTMIPYLGYKTIHDPLYQASRSFAQSTKNPFFFVGSAAQGTGSPHVPGPNIWPMGIIGRAMTSEDEKEIRDCVAWLKASQAGTGFMHESFDKDDPRKFSRPWFAWVNNLFGDLVIKIARENPHILAQPTVTVLDSH
jgi:meiotically up-regulated gene 157 (Mug157) protein